MEKIKLLILFGGVSNEHEVSRMSTASILKYIDETKYEITKVGITKEGEWFVTSATGESIFDGTWENLKDNKKVMINFDKENRGVVTQDGQVIKIDCVLLMMHGQNAEDGSMQGLWQIVGIPYTGSHVMASANAMDKMTAKIIANNAGIRQAEYYALTKHQFVTNPENELKNIENALGDKYPLFVKPANSGSSVGITKVHDEKELFEGLKIAFAIDSRVVIEEGIVGREIEIAVLGNLNPKASRVGEILSANEDIYDYEAKYSDTNSKTRIVTDLSEKVEMDIRNEALKVYKAFDCRGLSRVDFFYTQEGNIIFNEINTLPGFTNISMYPKLWEDMGIKYNELIDILINLAMEEE